MRQWYRFNAKADDPVAELFIFDDIGKSWWNDDAVTAKKFIDDLKALPASVVTARVRVNSLGGDAFEAVAIANALRMWGAAEGRTVETSVEGIAASAASIVIMAGQKITIGDNALIMVHDPSTIEIGNAAQMRKTADTLDTVRDTIVATYKWHSRKSDEELVALMAAETWMSADEAIANGFATEKIEGLKAAASIDPRALAKVKVPAQYADRVKAFVKPAPEPKAAASATDVLRACKAGDCLDLAEGLITAGATMDAVKAKVAEAKAAKTAADARAAAIRAVCTMGKVPELADGYIDGGMTADAVKAHITCITAKLDKIEIDGSLPVDQRTKAKVDVFAAYADLKRRRIKE